MNIINVTSDSVAEFSIMLEPENSGVNNQPFIARIYGSSVGYFYLRFYPSGHSKMDPWDRDLIATREKAMQHVLEAAEYWLENFYRGRHS